VDEGTLQQDFTGRVWNVKVANAEAGRQEVAEEAQEEKERKAMEKAYRDGNRLIATYDRLAPDRKWVSFNKARDAAGLNARDGNRALDDLVSKGTLEVDPEFRETGRARGGTAGRGIRRPPLPDSRGSRGRNR
jgi:hypothetical protein